MRTLLLAALVLSLKSDPIGVYAVIDKVVLEPKEGKPERIQIWGSFCLAKGRNGMDYEPPARGYLYYSLDPQKAETCRTEWSDLGSVAAKGQGVGFGSRYAPLARLRSANEKPEAPDIYRIGWGIQKAQGGPIGLLKQLPAPLRPAEAEVVAPGAVKLVARNAADTSLRDLQYVFEIENGAGAKETSSPLPAGDKETEWAPKLEIKAGEKYSWRVWVVGKDLKGPAASSSFAGKK
ncbi:MAG: hypothetical protein HY293_08385 [Planctomycetes bacterium]|nr:hypothetical protein [Planctomycetota bacterium]